MVCKPPRPGPSVLPDLLFLPSLAPHSPAIQRIVLLAQLVPSLPHLCTSICAVLLTGLHEALLFTQELVQAQFLLEAFPGGSCLCPPQNLGGTFVKSTSNILLHRITTTSISHLHNERSLYGRRPRMTHPFAPQILAQYSIR